MSRKETKARPKTTDKTIRRPLEWEFECFTDVFAQVGPTVLADLPNGSGAKAFMAAIWPQVAATEKYQTLLKYTGAKSKPPSYYAGTPLTVSAQELEALFAEHFPNETPEYPWTGMQQAARANFRGEADSDAVAAILTHQTAILTSIDKTLAALIDAAAETKKSATLAATRAKKLLDRAG